MRIEEVDSSSKHDLGETGGQECATVQVKSFV
jgi:hypothetical protein